MPLIVAGTVRIPPAQLETFRPYMEAMLTLSRQEDGCLEYSYAIDILDPGLIRVFEVWRDAAAVADHFASAHMQQWRAAWNNFGVSERQIIAYEVASQEPI